jgi:hypothetical protein
VSGTGDPFDGRFVIDSVAEATVSTPFQVTYKVGSIDLATATVDESSQVETGSVVVIPPGTRLTTDPNTEGQVFTFETDIGVTLDTAAARARWLPHGVTVTYQTTASEGNTSPSSSSEPVRGSLTLSSHRGSR